MESSRYLRGIPNRSSEGERGLAKVRKVMSTNVPRLKSSDTILDAATVMNREKTSGAAVVEGEKVVGLITERALLWKFLPLNKRPDKVSVAIVERSPCQPDNAVFVTNFSRFLRRLLLGRSCPWPGF